MSHIISKEVLSLESFQDNGCECFWAILGSGKIKDKINIEADLASRSAVVKLEKIGGSIQIKK